MTPVALSTFGTLIKSMFNFSFLPEYLPYFVRGVAYTLQIVGQKFCPAAIAPLLMSLESVFAALAGWLILSESLTLWQGIGCFLIFSAILLIQIPLPSRKKE